MGQDVEGGLRGIYTPLCLRLLNDGKNLRQPGPHASQRIPTALHDLPEGLPKPQLARAGRLSGALTAQDAPHYFQGHLHVRERLMPGEQLHT